MHIVGANSSGNLMRALHTYRYEAFVAILASINNFIYCYLLFSHSLFNDYYVLEALLLVYRIFRECLSI